MGLFKRPAWAQVQEPEEDTEQSLFSHSSRSHEAILAEQQRQKKERAEKEKKKQERKESKDSSKRENDTSDYKEQGSNKKRSLNRRINSKESEDLLSSVGLSPAGAAAKSKTQDPGESKVEDVAHRRSSREQNTGDREDSRSKEIPKASTVIDLGDSDGDNEVQGRPDPPVEPDPTSDSESDEEFAELRRRARAQKLKEEEAKRKTQAPDAKSPTPGLDGAGPSRIGLPTPPPAQDPPVKLLVTSELDNTRPLMVYRKLTQRLQEIRVAWCQKQGFSDEFTKGIFLIHKLSRLYDSTTCRSLGLYIDKDGQIKLKGSEMPQDAQIHLEAVTEEIFERKKAEKARQERAREKALMGEPDEEADVQAAEAPKESAAKEEANVRIVLRAKGVSQPFKLKVKPIMMACRGHFSVGERQHLWLELDGERLDPDDMIQSTDIEDMDNVDVYIAG
ncbi:hypothetical protein KC338_g3841 [Hortaea werneckii]|nr:hypothetical protein KC323_g4765 [Hortaea werneckii]KAI6868729.1 hypothetical protein KC338_g3841 [Hortaea werneckii]KAI7352845.1 hypothetical protein KC320_g4274 [Hortaea werneckii]